jgi:hypothetical protein
LRDAYAYRFCKFLWWEKEWESFVPFEEEFDLEMFVKIMGGVRGRKEKRGKKIREMAFYQNKTKQ